MDKELTILYEDEAIIVCHKPAGIPVQSARVGQKDMVSILNNYLADSRRENLPVYVVHRLDQPVEGVLVFAKNRRAAAGLSQQVAAGTMKKIYQAACCVSEGKLCAAHRAAGRPGDASEKTGYEIGETYRLVDYLARDGRANASVVVDRAHREARRAELLFRIKAKRFLEPPDDTEGCPGADLAARRGREYYLVEIELKTGRRHQIRVQMAHAGLPLYGDRKYNESWQDFLAGSHGQPSSGLSPESVPLALCAVSLTFRHPGSGGQMTFETVPRSIPSALFQAEAPRYAGK